MTHPKSLARLHRFVAARRLPVALGLAVFATIMLTFASLTIYKVGGFYRYDLSRPGYENERAGLVNALSTVSLDTTSPITQESLVSFIAILQEHHQNLDAYNTFGNGGLSDEDLLIAPPNP